MLTSKDLRQAEEIGAISFEMSAKVWTLIKRVEVLESYLSKAEQKIKDGDWLTDLVRSGFTIESLFENDEILIDV